MDPITNTITKDNFMSLFDSENPWVRRVFHCKKAVRTVLNDKESKLVARLTGWGGRDDDMGHRFHNAVVMMDVTVDDPMYYHLYNFVKKFCDDADDTVPDPWHNKENRRCYDHFGFVKKLLWSRCSEFALDDLISLALMTEITKMGRRDKAQLVIEKGQGLLEESDFKRLSTDAPGPPKSGKDVASSSGPKAVFKTPSSSSRQPPSKLPRPPPSRPKEYGGLQNNIPSAKAAGRMATSSSQKKTSAERRASLGLDPAKTPSRLPTMSASKSLSVAFSTPSSMSLDSASGGSQKKTSAERRASLGLDLAKTPSRLRAFSTPSPMSLDSASGGRKGAGSRSSSTRHQSPSLGGGENAAMTPHSERDLPETRSCDSSYDEPETFRTYLSRDGTRGEPRLETQHDRLKRRADMNSPAPKSWRIPDESPLDYKGKGKEVVVVDSSSAEADTSDEVDENDVSTASGSGSAGERQEPAAFSVSPSKRSKDSPASLSHSPKKARISSNLTDREVTPMNPATSDDEGPIHERQRQIHEDENYHSVIHTFGSIVEDPADQEL